VIYLDASALVKLVRAEAGSAALKRWLAPRTADVLLSSVLADVEVTRAVRRSAPELLDRVPGILEALELVELSPAVRALAGGYSMPTLRAADAVHLASAELVARETAEVVEAFVCYDRVLSSAAAQVGMLVVAPA
jgi:predicted nucleic acid-binding protein